MTKFKIDGDIFYEFSLGPITLIDTCALSLLERVAAMGYFLN